nr:hypothetical protein [Tanacetum cinerariifolium]
MLEEMNGGIQVAHNAVQNAGVQNGGNQNGLVVVPGIANQNGTGNIISARAEGTGNRNQARCYNCRGLGHIARNCTVRPKRKDVAYLQNQLLIAQKEEAGIQLQAEEFDFMAAVGDLDKIEEVNANCIFMAYLQHASTSGTQLDKDPVYDTDGSAEVQLNGNCYDNEIFNMFTQEKQYTDLLEPIPEPQLVLQNDNHVTSVAPSMVQSGGTVETSSAPNEETCAHQETIYRNLVNHVALVNMVNCNMRATNVELKSELAIYKIQEQRIEIKEHNPSAVYDSEETLELAQESHEKMRFLKKEIELANYAKINHLSGVFVPQTTKSKEELFLSNVSNIVTVSKTISIPNEDLSDDTTPSVARKFLDKVKNSLVTLQRVVKQKMTLEVHNWSSSAHKEVHKIISHKISPIINQVDAKVQNFEIQFLQEAAKFVRDLKSFAKEADESLDKQKSLELEIKRLLKESDSHDIMSIVQNGFVNVPSDLQTELDRTKEKLELCIIKKEKEYAVERLQAQLRDLKGKSSDTPSASNMLDPLNQKLETKIVELEFQVVDKPKLIDVTPYSKKLHASTPSHSVPQPKEFNVMKQSNVITPGMFKIDPSQTSKVDLVPSNQSSASIRINPITNFLRHVTFKENVCSDTVNASSIGLVYTARIRRPRPKGNTRNARVPSASKSSEVKKNVIVEDHRRILLLFKNQKTMSYECNNIKLAIRNDKSKIVCGTCNANQKRHRIQVWKPKQVRLKYRLACTPKPRLPRFSLKWSPSGRSFDLKGKLVSSKEANCPNDDKACPSNPQEPVRKRFPNSTVFLGRVYFVEGLGHNLFSVGQFCDANLEVAFKGNTCFIRDLDGVDLLKGNLSTNLYTINLYDMASASPICLMARKSKRDSHPPKPVLNSKQRLHLLHMDLCGPMRVASINGKRYVLVIVDDCSRYTWVYFLRTKDEMPEAKAIATACYTQNHSIIRQRFNKTPYELIQGRKLDISYLHVFGALCYPKNDREDIGKLGAKGDIGFFIGYSTNYVPYRVYNRRIKKIMETMNVMFNELSAMAFKQFKTRSLKSDFWTN